MSSATSVRSNAHQVPQTTGDTQYNVRDAALLGASSAFSKPPVKPKPQTNTYTGGNNGALLAATKVGTGRLQKAPVQGTAAPLSQDRTGGSSSSRLEPSPFSNSSSSSMLGVPVGRGADRSPSPSNIAAKMAAARFSPMRTAGPSNTTAERGTNERDVLPPAGSVGNLLARLDSRPANPRPLSSRGSTGPQSIANRVQAPPKAPTDDTPVPPTASLVKMFEQKRPTTPVRPSAEPLPVTQKTPPPIRSPKPQRVIRPPPVVSNDDAPSSPKPKPQKKPEPPSSPKPKLQKKPEPPSSPKPNPQKKPKPRALSMDGFGEDVPLTKSLKPSLNTPPLKQKPPQLMTVKSAVLRPKPPAPRGSRQARPMSEDLSRSNSLKRHVSNTMSIESDDNYVSAQEEQEPEPYQAQEKQRPSLPPPRRSTKAKSESSETDTRSKSLPMPPPPRKSNTSKSPLQFSERLSPHRPTEGLVSASSSETLFRSNYGRESAKQLTQHLTGESISNAIVGAALASARMPSRGPSRGPSPGTASTTSPPPSRKHHHHLPSLHHDRSPSPQKPSGKLRTTLRKDPTSSSDEDESEKYKKKGTRIMGMRKKHPNKHHEGTRKRWRDSITERERKRYEGVWAANKGICIPDPSRRSSSGGPQPEDPMQDVSNLVVKDLWSRSRLPEHELEEIWDLVDGRGVGRLRREEFVVGMWLVDQRLKGRKIPIRVSDSVWHSVRGVGVKVKVRPHK